MGDPTSGSEQSPPGAVLALSGVNFAEVWGPTIDKPATNHRFLAANMGHAASDRTSWVDDGMMQHHRYMKETTIFRGEHDRLMGGIIFPS